jgi:light-regulated signal transduction histidine kinase (bacteriophytochrome)
MRQYFRWYQSKRPHYERASFHSHCSGGHKTPVDFPSDILMDFKNISDQLEERTAQLEDARHEIESFSFSVSHDLRAPLRHIDGYSQALVEDCYEQLDSTGQNYIERIRTAAQHMNDLIDAVLTLSRLSRTAMNIQSINLSEIANAILEDLRRKFPERQVDIVIERDLITRGDPYQMKVALQHLLENAWKFSGRVPLARITVGSKGTKGKRTIFYVKDNGAGFNMAQIDKLFGAFQRLHSVNEFPGIGIGLATVKRIIFRHGGEVWAEGTPGQGATFYFTL